MIILKMRWSVLRWRPTLRPNSAEYIISYFACWKLGATAGPVNSLLKDQEMTFGIDNSEARAILVHSEFEKRIQTIRAQIPHLKSIIRFDDEADVTLPFR